MRNHLETVNEQADKKRWGVPTLDVLEVKETQADGYWRFVESGDFWKREFVPGIMES